MKAIQHTIVLIIAFFCMCPGITSAQTSQAHKEQMERFQSLMDTLSNLYIKPNQKTYMTEALGIALDLNNDTMLYSAYIGLARYFDQVGDFQRALEYEYKALDLAKKIRHIPRQAMMLSNIAWVYVQAYNYAEGIRHCRQAIALLDSIEDEYEHANVARFIFNNMAFSLTEQGDLEEAFAINQKSEAANKLVNAHDLQGWIFGQYGKIADTENDIELAEKRYKECIHYADSVDHPTSLVYGAVHLAHMLNRIGRHREALKYANLGLKVGLDAEYNRYLIDAAAALRTSYAELGVSDSAYQYANLEIEIRDSLFSAVKNQNMNDVLFSQQIKNKEKKHELEMFAQEKELERERIIRNISFGGSAVLALFGLLVLFQRNRISKERKKSDELLLNILPEEIAQELKEKGKASARNFEEVSILFTDFKGFTEASEKLSAQDLVAEINTCFEAFDRIMAKYGIEKIKTIGDAYMAAGGLPIPTENFVRNTVLAALEMQAFIGARSEELGARGLPFFEMRVGIHTGPVVAGIVGVKKFQYDIWGDTVNTASRMESAGEVGKVNVSQATYELLKDDPQFVFEGRGKIEAKGKGEMEMWFVQLDQRRSI